MRELRITSPAQDDLAKIVDYLSIDLCNVQAAAHLLDVVSSAYEAVCDNPCVCRLCANPQLSARGYRAMAVMRYLMIYRYDETEDIVYVVRFFHSLQKYETQLS